MKKIVALVLSLVMVLGLATVATAAPAFDENTDYYLLCEDGAFRPATFTAADVEVDGSGWVDHFFGNGTYWVVCDKADAEASIWDGEEAGDSLLAYVKAGEVSYDAVGEKVAASKLSCTTDKNAKGYKVMNADGVTYVYYEDAPASAALYNKLLVDGKVVKVVAQDDVVFGGHALAKNKTAALDVKKTGYEYKCVVCGEIFDGYSKKVAGVTYTKYVADADRNNAFATLGYDTSKVEDTQTLYLVDVAPVVDTDKVESAQTFDAGIAMYVGMSVMAAAGSAVVLKKKD